MGKSWFRAALLLGVVFVLGMASGAAVFHVGQVSMIHGLHSSGDHPRGHGPVSERISHDLGLHEDQAQRLHEILQSTHERMRGIFDESREEIRGLLTPEQLERFEEMHGFGLRKRRGGPFPPHPEPPTEP